MLPCVGARVCGGDIGGYNEGTPRVQPLPTNPQSYNPPYTEVLENTERRYRWIPPNATSPSPQEPTAPTPAIMEELQLRQKTLEEKLNSVCASKTELSPAPSVVNAISELQTRQKTFEEKLDSMFAELHVDKGSRALEPLMTLERRVESLTHMLQMHEERLRDVSLNIESQATHADPGQVGSHSLNHQTELSVRLDKLEKQVQELEVICHRFAPQTGPNLESDRDCDLLADSSPPCPPLADSQIRIAVEEMQQKQARVLESQADLELTTRKLQDQLQDLKGEETYAQLRSTSSNLKSDSTTILAADMVHNAFVSEHAHTIGDSTWEAAIVAFIPGLSHGASFMLVLVTFFNVVIQILFVSIVSAGLKDGDVFMDKDQAISFRLGLGHDYQLMDQDRWVSLIARVCGGDESLEIGTAQVDIMNIINDYIGTDISVFGRDHIPVGNILCTTVLIIWVLYIVQEIRLIVSFVLGVCQLPKTTHCVTVHSDSLFEIASISIARLSFILGLSFLRSCIAVALMTSGCIFIANTAGLANLILNGVALLFVMDVDELLFTMVVPIEIHGILHRLKALRKPLGSRLFGVSPTSIGVICGTIAVVVWAHVFFVQKTHTNLLEIREELCIKGSTDFVVGVAEAGFSTVTSSNPYQEGLKSNSLVAAVAEDIIHGGNLEGTTLATYQDNRGGQFGALLKLYTSQTVAPTLFDGFQFCYDLEKDFWTLAGNPGTWYAAAHLANNPSASTCNDLSSLCSRPEGTLARAYCGQTCNCSSPTAGSRTLKYPGCAPRCQQIYQNVLKDLECRESTVQNMEEPVLRAFQWLYDDIQNSRIFASKSREAWTQEVANSIQGGCAGLVQFFDGFGSNQFYDLFCKQGELAAFCPTECSCHLWPLAVKSCPPKCCSDSDAMLQIFSRGMFTTCQEVPCNETGVADYCPAHCGLCNHDWRLRTPYILTLF